MICIILSCVLQVSQHSDLFSHTRCMYSFSTFRCMHYKRPHIIRYYGPENEIYHKSFCNFIRDLYVGVRAVTSMTPTHYGLSKICILQAKTMEIQRNVAKQMRQIGPVHEVLPPLQSTKLSLFDKRYSKF